MIKRAQIKFVCIIMTILFGVFLILSGVTAFILRSNSNNNIDQVLNDMTRTIPFASNENPSANSFIVRLNINNTYTIISADQTTFTNENVDTLVNEIVQRPRTVGRIDDVSYKFFDFNNQIYILALDASDYLAELSNSLLRTVLIYFAIYILLLVVVYLFSFSVFEPIKESFAKQQQFVSNASHELKTPLTIISANADVIRQTNQSQWLDNIKTQTERLELIINDMLEMAKIDENSYKLTKEQFNLSEEVIKASLPFDALAFEKSKILELDVAPDIIHFGDKESVKKILNILLDNAVKYSNKDGLIRVSLYKKNGKSVLSVYNTGSSVPSKEVKKIFERFYRFDNSRSRETGGSGLGLSIAKSIASANKWKISATSKPNEYMQINVVL